MFHEQNNYPNITIDDIRVLSPKKISNIDNYNDLEMFRDAGTSFEIAERLNCLINELLNLMIKEQKYHTRFDYYTLLNLFLKAGYNKNEGVSSNLLKKLLLIIN